MSWIRLDNGTRVNLDHVETVEFRKPVDRIGLTHHRVLFYIARDIDPIVACEGSEQKCKRFLVDLDDSLKPVYVEAYELVKCQCECGCQAMIREDFEFCDECSEPYHLQDYHEHLAELKKDAV
jgi:hypothetical protein